MKNELEVICNNKDEEIIDSYEVISTPVGQGIALDVFDLSAFDTYKEYLNINFICENFDLIKNHEELINVCDFDSLLLVFNNIFENFEDKLDIFIKNNYKKVFYFNNELPYHLGDATVFILENQYNLLCTNEYIPIIFEEYEVIMFKENDKQLRCDLKISHNNIKGFLNV